MANYADEIDPVAPVDMTAAAGLTASAKNGYLEDRLSKRQDLIEARPGKRRQLCALVTRHLSEDVLTTCSSCVGWDEAVRTTNLIFIWKKVRDLLSTPSTSNNPVVRSREAEENFAETRQYGELNDYIKQFNANFNALDADRKQAYGQQNRIDRFIQGLIRERYAFFIQRYNFDLSTSSNNATPFATFADAVQAVKDAESTLTNQGENKNHYKGEHHQDDNDGDDDNDANTEDDDEDDAEDEGSEDADDDDPKDMDDDDYAEDDDDEYEAEDPHSIPLATDAKRFREGGDYPPAKRYFYGNHRGYDRTVPFQGYCFNCGEQGHRAYKCRSNSKADRDGGGDQKHSDGRGRYEEYEDIGDHDEDSIDE
jgi:hypothetical protein